MDPLAYFHWFEYSGNDSVFERPVAAGQYRNPIAAGFYPDPSITRVGDVYYLVNSTFTYFPGIPVFESRDLAHWCQIGNVIDRPGELNFDGLNVSRGVFAPSIRYHDGVFYVLNTAVNSGGNFLSVARNPAGPWSDPIWFPDVDGIDRSLFFDDDGKVYLLNNGLPEEPPKYDGHRAIWMQQFDPATAKLFGPRRVLLDGGVDISKQPVWIEGPHLYRHDGWYYLMCAEGGTSTQHSEVVLRARSPWGPFKPFAGNPILTQRDLPPQRANPIANAGHADLVEGSDGRWWAVFLATRPYEGSLFNTGRETFLLPVTWKDGWPTILPHGTEVPYVADAPAPADTPAAALSPTGTAAGATSAAPPLTGNFTWRDSFNSPELNQQWMYVRVPKQHWADLTTRTGWLTIHALPAGLDSLQNMSFLARRQQHTSFDASTEVELPTENAHLAVGLAAFQNENFWYFLGIRAGTVFLQKRGGHATVTRASVALRNKSARSVKLRIAAHGREYSFYFDDTVSGDNTGSGWKPLLEHDDGSILSTEIAGGFVGAFVGPYARSE